MTEYITEFREYVEAVGTYDFSQVAKLLHKNITFCHSGQMKTNSEQIIAFHENFWTIKDVKWWATDVELLLQT